MMKSFPLIPLDIYRRIKRKRLACVSCPVGCKDVVEIPDGEHQGLVIFSSSAVNLFMPMIYGFQDYRQAAKLIADLDEYGLDMFEFFGLMGLTKKLHDLGIISTESVQPGIAVDSLESLEAWAGKIAFREGLGHVLADGFQGLCEAFGPEVSKHAPPIIKGMIPYAGPGAALPWDLFGTMELGQILDPRGPHVGSGGSPTYFAKRPLDVFPKHLARMGAPPEAVERILPGQGDPAGPRLEVGRLLKYSHAWFSTLGSLGICARAQINRFYNAALCADLYEAVTGIPTTWPELNQRVDRIWTLLRMANVREGLSRNDETPPEQWFKAPGFKEYLTEKPMTRRESERMIGDYYREWGWDTETGIPSEETLNDLDLTELI